VYYTATDGHVHELAWVGKWAARDLTAETHAPAPATVSGTVTCCALNNGQPRVYYTGKDGHLQELAWLGSNWAGRDITLSTFS
jgi:hypothetical protein